MMADEGQDLQEVALLELELESKSHKQCCVSGCVHDDVGYINTITDNATFNLSYFI